MRLTKLDMAKVIVQALYNLPKLPSDDHPQVLKRANRGTVRSLTAQHELACKALASVKSLTLPVADPCPGVGWTLATGNTDFNKWVR